MINIKIIMYFFLRVSRDASKGIESTFARYEAAADDVFRQVFILFDYDGFFFHVLHVRLDLVHLISGSKHVKAALLLVPCILVSLLESKLFVGIMALDYCNHFFNFAFSDV
jgi:hypothetical protein